MIKHRLFISQNKNKGGKMERRYNLMQITKTLEKIFKAGFTDDKSILAIKLEDIVRMEDMSSTDLNILMDLKSAIKEKKVIKFLSRSEDKNKIYKREEETQNGI